MILIGHSFVESKPFYRISEMAHIALTPPSSTVFFDYDTVLCRYCQAQKIASAVHVKHIKELVLAHALGASFLIVDKALVLNAQKIANDYLFDGKILLLAHDEQEIEFAALNGIDGIILPEGIKSL